MPALALLRRFVAWRWTPSVALVFAAAAFAGLAIALIPDELGAAPVSAARLARERVAIEATSEANGVETAALEDETSGVSGAIPGISRRRPRSMGKDLVGNIFHPVGATELPIEPVDPTPQAPPPAPPPPPATATIYTMPEVPAPPPVQAPPAVPPPAPAPPGAVVEPSLVAPANHP